MVLLNMHVIEHTYVSLLADVARITGFSEIRGSNYGLQWCLNEAPKLEKQLLAAVETGCEPDFDKWPAELRGLARASLVDAQMMRAIRQLLLFCYKAYVTHDNKTTEATYEGFLRTNRDLGSWTAGLSRASPYLLKIARRHCQSVLSRFRAKAIKPSHGPGAVTTSKDTWRKTYSTIECIYPYSDWFYLYFNRDHAEQWDGSDHEDIIQAKVIDVPKDTRGPRLICVHPAEAIWIQQGVRRELERVISLPRSAKGPWPHGHIFFNDQSVNGKIALLSSKSRRYATIDMKEASDRISDALVQILFGDMYKYFGCCRATEFMIPNHMGKTHVTDFINSYAPMGNATTFPVQSLVFWSICVASLQYHGFHQPGAVFVFGDDIIIPSEAAETVIDDLESFGLLVNRTKSFWRGAFRESCGVDAFKGVNVTPIRWKTTVDAEHPSALLSLSDLGMRLRIHGYEEAAITVYAILRCRLRARYGKQLFLTNNRNHGGIAEYTTCDSSAWRDAFWHRDLQKFCSPVWRLSEIPNDREIDGWNHILESICRLSRKGEVNFMGRDPTSTAKDVSRRLRLNRGWTDLT